MRAECPTTVQHVCNEVAPAGRCVHGAHASGGSGTCIQYEAHAQGMHT